MSNFTKKDGGVIVRSFAITQEVDNLINIGKEIGGFKSYSEYISDLVLRNSFNDNPTEIAKEIDLKLANARETVRKIEDEQRELLKKIEAQSKWQTEKRKNIPKAVSIISQKILKNNLLDAETCAKTWSKLCSTTPEELLLKSMELINNGI